MSGRCRRLQHRSTNDQSFLSSQQTGRSRKKLSLLFPCVMAHFEALILNPVLHLTWPKLIVQRLQAPMVRENHQRLQQCEIVAWQVDYEAVELLQMVIEACQPPISGRSIPSIPSIHCISSYCAIVSHLFAPWTFTSCQNRQIGRFES